jgi:hypothetical protein
LILLAQQPGVLQERVGESIPVDLGSALNADRYPRQAFSGWGFPLSRHDVTSFHLLAAGHASLFESRSLPNVNLPLSDGSSSAVKT